MPKFFRRLLALCAAAALLFTLAACTKDKPSDPAEPDASVTTAVEPDTLDVVVTTDVVEPVDEPETETTTVEETTGVPSGKTEIVAYVNEVMAKVREEKPGYTKQERTHIDDKKITSSSGFIQSIAPPIIRMAKNTYSNWSDPKVKEKGGNHDGVMPKTDLKDSWVKSASLKDSGSTYNIRINLVDERVRELPANDKDTMHGKITMSFTKSDIEDGAGKVGVKILKFDCLYNGSYIEMTVDKATGLPKKIVAYTAEKVDLEAKLAFTVDASLPLANETMYTF